MAMHKYLHATLRASRVHLTLFWAHIRQMAIDVSGTRAIAGSGGGVPAGESFNSPWLNGSLFELKLMPWNKLSRFAFNFVKSFLFFIRLIFTSFWFVSRAIGNLILSSMQTEYVHTILSCLSLDFRLRLLYSFLIHMIFLFNYKTIKKFIKIGGGGWKVISCVVFGVSQAKIYFKRCWLKIQLRNATTPKFSAKTWHHTQTPPLFWYFI